MSVSLMQPCEIADGVVRPLHQDDPGRVFDRSHGGIIVGHVDLRLRNGDRTFTRAADLLSTGVFGHQLAQRG